MYAAGLILATTGIFLAGWVNPAEAADDAPMQAGAVSVASQPTPLRFGVDDAGLPRDLDTYDWAARAFREMGFDLWVCHARLGNRTVAGYVDGFRRVDAWCAKNGVCWVWNLEGANWIKTYVDDQGRDWFNRPDGRHYELIPDDVLAEMAKSTQLLGVEYDEPTHMQCCRNRIAFPEGPRPPWMYDPKNDELPQASDRFTASVSEVASVYERHGIAIFTEHVFSDLLHNFARAGYTPAPKILKESWAPIAIATAMGAAIQYQKELWITPDLWGPAGYPAHSVEEYRSSLVLAYAMGANTIYTENLAWDNKNQGIGSLVLVTDEGADYRITDYGKVAGWFAHEFVPAHPRYYDFRQVRPRVAIVRQPDSCWGQATSWLPDTLFGSDSWPSTPTTEAWFKIWHLLTRGVVPADGINWNGGGSYIGRPHQLFCPLDGVVVFDHYANAEHLRGVDVIFLTGLGVSDATRDAIASCVQVGATCVALPHLMPERVRAVTGDNGLCADGAGRWIATTDFLSPHVRKNIVTILPAYDTIRYQFGETKVRLHTVEDDPDRLAVTVESSGVLNTDSQKRP
ncbi:MAG: hypothetical protein ACYC6N_00175 [Pirellulaceae bacterium]